MKDDLDLHIQSNIVKILHEVSLNTIIVYTTFNA